MITVQIRYGNTMSTMNFPADEQFVDFEACGQMVVQSSQGMILSGEEGGFICMANDLQKSEIENEMHRDSQQMGEMQL